MDKSKYDVKRLDHLGLVAGFCKEIGLNEWVEWVALDNGYHGYWSTSHYGEVSQRWLLVKSSQAKAREEHILNKVVSKSTESSLKSFNRLRRKAFSCWADAKKALQEWTDTQEFITLYNEAIGEVLDITGWLGGYNFQWAWSSGWAAGQYV